MSLYSLLRIIYDHGFKQLVVVMFVIDVIVFCGSISLVFLFTPYYYFICVLYAFFTTYLFLFIKLIVRDCVYE